MINRIIFSLFIFIIQSYAFACPNLSGTWECNDVNWQKSTKFVSESRDQKCNNIFKGLRYYPVYPDGKTRTMPDTQGRRSFIYSTICSDETVEVTEQDYYGAITYVYSLNRYGNLVEQPMKYGQVSGKPTLCTKKITTAP